MKSSRHFRLFSVDEEVVVYQVLNVISGHYRKLSQLDEYRRYCEVHFDSFCGSLGRRTLKRKCTMMLVQFKISVPGEETKDVFLCSGGSISELVSKGEVDFTSILLAPEEVIQVTVDGHDCSLFFDAVRDQLTADLFLKYLVKTTSKRRFLIEVTVTEPKKSIMDLKGNEIVEHSVLERRELDHALAWFSTLGGAFSALGDSMTNCAIIAGKISTQQFKLALRLGDPNLQSRCRLYMALSQIQLKNFKAAKMIIKNEYTFASRQLVKDTKLISMCRGIWAKYKYEKAQAKAQQGINQLK